MSGKYSFPLVVWWTIPIRNCCDNWGSSTYECIQRVLSVELKLQHCVFWRPNLLSCWGFQKVLLIKGLGYCKMGNYAFWFNGLINKIPTVITARVKAHLIKGCIKSTRMKHGWSVFLPILPNVEDANLPERFTLCSMCWLWKVHVQVTMHIGNGNYT